MDAIGGNPWDRRSSIGLHHESNRDPVESQGRSLDNFADFTLQFVLIIFQMSLKEFLTWLYNLQEAYLTDFKSCDSKHVTLKTLLPILNFIKHELYKLSRDCELRYFVLSCHFTKRSTTSLCCLACSEGGVIPLSLINSKLHNQFVSILLFWHCFNYPFGWSPRSRRVRPRPSSCMVATHAHRPCGNWQTSYACSNV